MAIYMGSMKDRHRKNIYVAVLEHGREPKNMEV